MQSLLAAPSSILVTKANQPTPTEAPQSLGTQGSKTQGWKAHGAELLSGLFDLDFQTIVTTRMVPTIYRLGILLSGIFTLYCIVSGFSHSLMAGTAWLVLFGPALFIASLVTLRIGLEVILVLFRLAVTVENMDGVVNKIAGQTDEIVTDLPRIQFWKSWKRGAQDD